MGRLKLEMPYSFSFSCRIPIRITDLNYGNHVGNDAFVSILHEARVQYLTAKNFAELGNDRTGLIMADLQINFKKESVYGDILKVEVNAEHVTNTSFDLYYQLSTTRQEEVVTIAHAKTAMVFFNYTSKKVARLPDDFKASLY
ncbi:MAG: thioesterase family protein [Ginsengibacter sp.]